MQYGNSYVNNAYPRFYAFKSYYVVWKHALITQIFPWKMLFKSYYVVWKLKTSPGAKSFLICLNRTMQYGNFIFFVLFQRIRYRLNRTMQYGNESAPHSATPDIRCLNRTMQYGNRHNITSFSFRIQFKSYYVVWKHNLKLPFDRVFRMFKSYYVVWKHI